MKITPKDTRIEQRLTEHADDSWISGSRISECLHTSSQARGRAERCRDEYVQFNGSYRVARLQLGLSIDPPQTTVALGLLNRIALLESRVIKLKTVLASVGQPGGNFRHH